MASALAPTILTPGINLVRATFSDPEVRSLRGDWEAIARGVVARLRGLVGSDVDDPRLHAHGAARARHRAGIVAIRNPHRHGAGVRASRWRAAPSAAS